MPKTKQPETKYGITGLLITPDRAGQQRRLGKAYRLILSYTPPPKMAAVGESANAPEEPQFGHDSCPGGQG